MARPGGRQGNRRSPAARLEPAQRPRRSYRRQRGADDARSGSRRNCSEPRRPAISFGPACSSRRTAEHCFSTRSPTCRLATQGRILRVLTDQSFTRIGGHAPRQGRRPGCFGHRARPDGQEIAEGRFREDLYYRLNVVPVVKFPPLSDAARRHPDAGRSFRRALCRASAACRRTRSRLRCDGCAAILRLAGKCPAAAQRRRAHRDPRAPGDRIGRIDLDLLPAEVIGDQRRCRRTHDSDHGRTVAGSPRDVRARISAGTDPAFFGQHLAGPRPSSAWSAPHFTAKLKLLGITDTRNED